ncbi:MAG TPA: hypothetical protein VHE55_18895 [Fimbriimonadaceae bacterium]|nr:hypothetical protein [Fimbriimonadaceae bacterium]
MRKYLWIAVLPFLSVSFAQEAKVTYSTVAVTAKKAIADLAKKSGMQLECSPSMDSEILVLRLKDASMDQVMAQIAAVTSGTWTKEGEKYYLVADGSARNVEAAKQRQRNFDKLSASLKKLADSIKPKPKDPKNSKTDEEDQVPAQFAMMGMGNEDMIKIALAIGAGPLSAVPDGGRVVFSTNPNRMQSSLPSSVNAIITDYVAQHNKAAAAAKQEEPAKEQQDSNMAAFMEIFGSRFKKPETITTPPAKALVVASRRGMFMGFTLQLKLYDANGKTLATDSLPLSLDLPFDPQELAKPQAPPASQGPEIQLSPLAKELYDAGNSMSSIFGGGGLAHTKLSDALMAALKDPVEHDPLSYVHSEALLAIADQRNEQLVADLPDAVTSFFGNLVAKSKLTAASFLKEIKGDDKTQVKEANGWLTVMPDNPIQSRKERLNRVALRTLIQSAQSQGYTSLDDLAAYAQKNESPMDAQASMMYVMLFAPGALQQGMMGIVDWDMLRLYGMMDANQRQLLKQGRRVPFGQLTPEEQAQLTKMLFGADAALNAETRQDGTAKKQDPLTEMIFSQIERYSGGNENDFRTEPTEIMPNGLPTNGYVLLNYSTQPVAQPQTMSTDFGRGASMGPMELGMLKFFKDDPNMSQISGAIPTVDDLKVGTRSVYNFSFYVAPFVSEKQTLNDDVIPKDAPVYKMANLPSDFQKQIDDMAAAMSKNPIWKMIGQMGGFGQRAVPPQ